MNKLDTYIIHESRSGDTIYDAFKKAREFAYDRPYRFAFNGVICTAWPFMSIESGVAWYNGYIAGFAERETQRVRFRGLKTSQLPED